MDKQQVKKNQSLHFRGSIRNKHVFAALTQFLDTSNLIKTNIKGQFCEQMGKVYTCRLNISALNISSDEGNLT